MHCDEYKIFEQHKYMNVEYLFKVNMPFFANKNTDLGTASSNFALTLLLHVDLIDIKNINY